MDIIEAGRLVAADIRKYERSINAAVRDGAQLIMTLIDGGEAVQLSEGLLQPAIADVVASLGSLTSGQSTVALSAHPKLDRIGRRMGLEPTSWGSILPKTAEDAAPAVTAALEARTPRQPAEGAAAPQLPTA